MALILIGLAVVVILSLRGVFGAISTAGEVDESLLKASTPRLNKGKIDEALKSLDEREFIPLDL
ncbi:hypothetical protein A2803_04415 [Candidatus Woesebacteria bacterium RIFCSPHIGHO2_01_FULL_44_21]|uniref:Uncharacterized protein n=1 Tax=Candidatus Woesebacteria bacterium RIFCSPHIGHO2_01_FULL_44_21 TaxID=1802503 RepID=A0A1F7YWT5_9BACT|nr:MAG: hypothetical protein A2803_04415 [Candidatus Woesebacteria bacterium RIFCSPHIGHO2_01_FULL_44_21]